VGRHLLVGLALLDLEQGGRLHPKSYVRVKAAALLKIEEGQSLQEVAAHGLLKAVKYETVRGWYWRYAQDGLAGLLVQTGRGRKPAFSPCAC